MTRRQALSRAVRLLSADGENKELCGVLEELQRELPLARWSRASILDAIEDYICEHGCLPRPKDMGSGLGLPSHMTVRKFFGMTVMEFEETYFPDYVHRCASSVYHRHDREYWLNNFKRQYERMGRPTMEVYQKEREAGTPCAAHIKKLAGAKTWGELVQMCDAAQEKNGGRRNRRTALDRGLTASLARPEPEDAEGQKKCVDDLESCFREICGDCPPPADMKIRHL